VQHFWFNSFCASFRVSARAKSIERDAFAKNGHGIASRPIHNVFQLRISKHFEGEKREGRTLARKI
jgi:hypothetical protein